MKRRTYDGLRRDIELSINELIQNKTEDQWDENSITHDLIEVLRDSLDDIEIIGDHYKTKIKCSAYKLKSVAEQKHGDITIIIRIRYADGDLFTGVAYLEAKKKKWNGRIYDEISQKQSEEIMRHTRNAYFLLYDHEPAQLQINMAGVFEKYWDDDLSCFVCRNLDVAYTHASVTPMNYLRKIPADTNARISRVSRTRPKFRVLKKDCDLYKFAQPFSYQFCFRYLQGLDLELDPKRIAAILHHEKRVGIPHNIISFSIAQGGYSAPEQDDLINTDLYRKRQNQSG